MLEQTEKKKKEQSLLTDRLKQLESEYEEKLEKEVELRESLAQEQGREAMSRVMQEASEERLSLEEERDNWQTKALELTRALQRRRGIFEVSDPSRP